MVSEAGEARSDSLAQSKHPYLTKNPAMGTAPENVTRNTASHLEKSEHTLVS